MLGKIKFREKILTEWVHAFQILVKIGQPRPLAFLGFCADIALDLVGLKRSPVVHLGQKLEFSFSNFPKNKKTEKLVADFIIHFQKVNGSTASKVFKLKNFSFQGF